MRGAAVGATPSLKRTNLEAYTRLDTRTQISLMLVSDFISTVRKRATRAPGIAATFQPMALGQDHRAGVVAQCRCGIDDF
jgi:hypothetical protein